MRVVDNKGYTPITITLETQEEFMTIFNIVNCNNNKIYNMMKDQYGEDWRDSITMSADVIYDLYQSLKENR